MHSFVWCNKTLIPLVLCIVISNLIQIGVSDCSVNNRYCDRFTRTENRRLDEEVFNLNRNSERIDSRRRTERDETRRNIGEYHTSQEGKRNAQIHEFRRSDNRALNINSRDNERNVLSQFERDESRNNNGLRNIQRENVRGEERNMKIEQRAADTRDLDATRSTFQQTRNEESRLEHRRLDRRNNLKKNGNTRHERRIESRNIRTIENEMTPSHLSNNERRDVREGTEQRRNLNGQIDRSYEENSNLNRNSVRFQDAKQQERQNMNNKQRRENRRMQETEIRYANRVSGEENRRRERHVVDNFEDRHDRKATPINKGEERLRETRRVVKTKPTMRNERTRDLTRELDIHVSEQNDQLIRSISKRRLNSIRLVRKNKPTLEFRRQSMALIMAEQRDRENVSPKRERVERLRTEINSELAHRRDIVGSRRIIKSDILDQTRRTHEIREQRRQVERIQIDRGNERSAVREYQTFNLFAKTALKSNIFWYMLQLIIIGFVTLKITNKQSADCKKPPFLVKLNSSLSKLKIF